MAMGRMAVQDVGAGRGEDGEVGEDALGVHGEDMGMELHGGDMVDMVTTECLISLD